MDSIRICGTECVICCTDLVKTARATAAFRFHLDMHLGKEDAHLYRIFREKIPLPEQGKALGIMSSMIPQERFAEMVAWLYPLIGNDDRENMTLIRQKMMPVPVFAGVRQLIRKAIPGDWPDLSGASRTLKGNRKKEYTFFPACRDCFLIVIATEVDLQNVLVQENDPGI